MKILSKPTLLSIIIFFVIMSSYSLNVLAEEKTEGKEVVEENVKKIRIAYFLSPNSVVYKKLLRPWADKVEAESHGKMKVKIYSTITHNSSANDLIEKVRSGAVDAFWGLVGYTPGQFPKTELLELPFITKGITKAEVINQVLDEFYETHLQDEFEDLHVILLHVHAPGTLHLKNNKVKNLADLADLKIRVPNKNLGKLLEKFGITPVNMPLPDVYESLSSRVVDGAAVPFEAIVPTKIYEKANHHISTPLYTTVFAFVMNKEFYESLPGEMKRVIDNNSRKYLVKDMGKAWDEAEKEMKQKVIDRNGTFITLSNSDISKLRLAADELVTDWKKKVKNGDELINSLKQLIEKYSNEYSQ
ncbi:MAG: TRAP transporter substrate-binding protein [Rickettsiaceae bacterium]|nr:TRAP transporter substrate-binding protein [Rickettsiaceae bacterium]